MVQIEIELLNLPADELYDLRNFLKEQIPETDFTLKAQPALPGQMSLELFI